jgi:hypothetical protein
MSFEQAYQLCVKIRHVRMHAGQFYQVVKVKGRIWYGRISKSMTKNINSIQYLSGGGARIAIPSKLKSTELSTGFVGFISFAFTQP